MIGFRRTEVIRLRNNRNQAVRQEPEPICRDEVLGATYMRFEELLSPCRCIPRSTILDRPFLRNV